MDAEDARHAADNGTDALMIVPNRGGWQLDGAPLCTAVLPEIVAAIGKDIDV